MAKKNLKSLAEAGVKRVYTPKEIKALKETGERGEDVPPVIKKIHKTGRAEPNPLLGLFDATVAGKRVVVEYEPDTELRDTEQVPLLEEGGLFRQTYRSADEIQAAALPPRYNASRSMATAIYYLLTDEPDSFSAMHRLPTDEVYHFYAGDPVDMLLLHPDGRGERVRLGAEFMNGQHVQFVVPRDVWQGSRLLPGGRWALMGTTMAPGYTDSDYVGGGRAELMARYPQFASDIGRLTRL